MSDNVVVEFDCDVQSLSALQAAAYRLIGTATCQIEKVTDRWRCHLAALPAASSSADNLRVRFLDLVSDENMRESIAVKTEPVRNLILSLAFGSLAEKANGSDQR